MRNFTPFALVFAIGVVTTIATIGTLRADFPGFGRGGTNLVMTNLSTIPDTRPDAGQPNIIAKAAKTVSPSIVSIYTESKPIAVQSPFSSDPFFRQFFGGNSPGGGQQTEREKGVGSGVIISSDGYILTNNHVIANAATVKVDLPDGKALSGKVIGADPTSDIAVVKIDPGTQSLTAATLGNSTGLEVGDEVIAAGDPLDIGTTVTHGIISAIGHRNTEETGRSMASDIIQTDAAINPGNSGGALADLSGHVIGINEAIISPTGSFVGIGLAIPINTARTVAEQLIEHGKVVRPYIGVAYLPLKGIDTQSRQQVGIDVTGDDGVVVTNVYPDSPAAKAGLRNYDVILDANGKPLTDDNQLQPLIQKLRVGDTLVLRVARGNDRPLVSIKVGEMPSNFGQNSDDNSPDQSSP